MSNENEELNRRRDVTVGPVFGGLNTDTSSELLQDNELTKAQNAVFSYNELHSDSGYVILGAVVRGNPRRVVEYIDGGNGVIRILITDLTVYRWNFLALQWQYPSDGTETTISVNEAAGQTVLSVTSIAGFADNDFVGIELNTGQMHFSQVNGAPAGGTITIDNALPSASDAGRAVIKAVVLAGSDNNHVTFETIPWSDNVVFTNGINNVKRFQPLPGLHGSVIDLTGTGFPANTKAETLMLYDNSLVIAGLSEGGTIIKGRFRYSAKGDITLWNTLEAGFTDLLENFGYIRQALPLGSYMIFYRDYGITRVQVGGTGRFLPESTVFGEGVSSKLAAVNLIDKHIVMGTGKFFFYRGGFSIEEVPCPIKESIFGESGDIKAGFISAGNIFAFNIAYTDEVIFSYGASIAARPYPRYHLTSQKWSKRAFGAAAHRISGFGRSILTAGAAVGAVYIGESTADQVYTYDLAANADGATNLTFEVDSKDFCHPTWFLTHDMLELVCEGSSGGTLTVSFSVNKGLNWTAFTPTITIPVTPTRFRLFQQFTTRCVRFRFNTTSPIVLNWFKMHYRYSAEW